MAARVKLQLINKLRSPNNRTVVRAVEAMRAQGWLEDGTLRGVYLRHVHLQGADLYAANLSHADLSLAHLQMANLSQADLEGARLSNANLYGADLSGTNLKGASLINTNLYFARNLRDEQLAQARSLWGSKMPDGSIYDGRFNLSGDLEVARAGLIDVGDQEAMARFYAGPDACLTIRVDRAQSPINTFSSVQLIQKLRNSDVNIVRQAVDELRARGHLADGSLQWVYLRYANLQGADLSGADLQMADLNLAHMQGADLSGANLQGARMHKVNLRAANMTDTNLQGASLAKVNLHGVLDLTDEQLAQTNRLRLATMPSGAPYDGRFNLAGDLADARFLHVDVNNARAMADFYGIGEEAYQQGQTWVQEHLPIVWEISSSRMASVDLESIFETGTEV